jgi:uncharacterized membrane protein YdjX (TVP38/TMEM64 family)
MEYLIERLKPLFTRDFRPILIVLLISISTSIVLLIFHERIIPAVEIAATYIKDLGSPGALLMICIIVTTCFPPVVGYATALTLCGFIYNESILYGFSIAYVGGLLGGMLVFIAARELFTTEFKVWKSNFLLITRTALREYTLPSVPLMKR